MHKRTFLFAFFAMATAISLYPPARFLLSEPRRRVLLFDLSVNVRVNWSHYFAEVLAAAAVAGLLSLLVGMVTANTSSNR